MWPPYKLYKFPLQKVYLQVYKAVKFTSQRKDGLEGEVYHLRSSISIFKSSVIFGWYTILCFLILNYWIIFFQSLSILDAMNTKMYKMWNMEHEGVVQKYPHFSHFDPPYVYETVCRLIFYCKWNNETK